MFYSRIKLVCLALYFAFANGQVYVSKSTRRTDADLLKDVPCLSRDNFIFYDSTDSTIEKVTWHTIRKDSSDEANIKTNNYYPYDLKGGSNMNAISWDTLNVRDSSYVLYTNVYRNDTISEKIQTNFVVCNTVSLYLSDNENMTDPVRMNSDSLITNNKYIGVLPSDDIQSISVTFDNIPLTNLVTNIVDVLAFVGDINTINLSTNENHIVVANFTTIFDSIGIRRVILSVTISDTPTASPTESPTESPTTLPTKQEKNN
jgi:hypothetical protein